MPTFRIMLEGRGTDLEGEAFGFFAARQVRATSEADAEALVMTRERADWGWGRTTGLGRLDALSIVRTRRVRWGWLRRPKGGFTRHDGDKDARATARRIESRAFGMG